MLIKYVGHSCFKIRDNDTGYSIVLDPYTDGSVDGYGKIVDSASEVLCSHEHDDHHGVEHINIEHMDESPFEITWIDTFHDPEKGALRGPNRIHIITSKRTGEKMVHYGDVGEKLDDLLTEENLALLKDADVAMVPVGGVYTYDRNEALELIEKTTPKLVLPMHYRSETLNFDFPHIDSIEKFLEESQKKGLKVFINKMFFIDTDEYKLDCDILALMPQNMQPGITKKKED
jgi:L-ascorbate metabolism protein UlaG (beta-lactamase superfamily)